MRKVDKNSSLEALLLYYPLIPLSKTPFQAANLPGGKYITAPPSTAKWYKVGQHRYEDKIQELNTDFAKICISPKPPWAPRGKVPLAILKELEHQARQNISTLNFATTFAKTSSRPATPHWRSASIVLRRPLRRSNLRLEEVPILKSQDAPMVAIPQKVVTIRFSQV